jgi:acetylglutamate kinase
MITVVKLGGRVQGDERLAAILAERWNAGVGTLCIVHGGGDAVSALQRMHGAQPAFVGGRRVTGDSDIALLRMALSGAANKELVARLCLAGVPAVGVSGEDAHTFMGTVPAGGPLGRVATTVTANPLLPRHLLAAGFLPVISPLAAAGDGGACNVNGDDAAAALAVALGANELILVADVSGVRDERGYCEALDLGDAARLIASGIAADGMAAKLEAAASALAGGVARVRIGGLEAITDPRAGTRIHESPSLV